MNFRAFIIVHMICLALFCASCIADDAVSIEISDRMQEIVKRHSIIIFQWANSPYMVDFVKEQNKKDMPLTEIKQIDKQWVLGYRDDLVKDLQGNSIGKFLKDKIENSIAYVEAFLCDKKGAIIGLYPKTTDYWQGDEAKFIESYGNGKGRIFYGPLKFDESSETYTVHVSVPVNDWNNTIGVLIVGIKNIYK